jgi:hypothetical protein
MGCTGEDAGRIIRELGKARVCDMVMESNDDVTIVCRRMKREGRNWELTRKRVARYRERHGSPMGPENETPPETQGLLLGNDDVTGEKPEARSQKLDIQPIAIYEAYPRHTARASALKAIHTALVTVSAERLLERTMAYAEAVSRWPAQDRTFIPYPATWFNRASYDDDPETWKRIQNANTRKGNSRGFEQSQSYEHVVNKL